MADLQSQLTAALQEATKQRELVKVSTLRLLISAIRYKEVEKKKTLADSDVLDVIQSEAKKRRESMEQYTQGGRPELAAKEKAELDVLAQYLPASLSAQELDALAKEAIQAANAKGPQDIGRVMSALMPKVKGRADGRQAQEAVKKLLG